MKDALAGNTVSAKEALEQIEREATIEEALQQEFGAAFGTALSGLSTK
jgi:hypothetical protein